MSGRDLCLGAVSTTVDRRLGCRADRRDTMMATKITVTEIPEAHLKQAVVAPLARFNEAQSGLAKTTSPCDPDIASGQRRSRGRVMG